MQVVPSAEPRAERSFLDGPGALAALLVAAAVVFTAASDRPLTHSELRYVEAGREMLETRDWIVPHLSYVAYFEKPILTYWLEAASQAAFGMSMIAVRAPFILACVAMTWTTYAFGRSLRGPRFGLGAAALLVSSAMFQELGPSPLTDGLFSAFLAFAWYAFWRNDRAPESRWIWAAWTSLGFAMLTKGPLGLVLAGTAVGAYLLLARRLRDVPKLRLVRGVLIVAAINLPWWWAAWERDPRYVWFFFVRENWKAFFSGHVNHAHGALYYAPYLAGMLFPFAVLSAWAICVEIGRGVAPALRGRASDPGPLFLACSFAAPFLFLSASASKLGTYLLPLLPTAALLVAGYVADRPARPSWAMKHGTLAQAVVAIVAVGLVFAVGGLPEDWMRAAAGHHAAIAVAAATMLGPMLVGGWAMTRGRIVPGMAVVAAGSFACVLVVNRAAPELGVEAEAGELVTKMKAVRKPDEPVVVQSALVDDYSIVLALRGRTHVLGKLAETGMGHFTEFTPKGTPFPESLNAKGEIIDVYDVGGEAPLPQDPWLLDVKEFRELWNGPGRVWYVGRGKDTHVWREMGFTVHVFAGKEDRVILVNHPVAADR